MLLAHLLALICLSSCAAFASPPIAPRAAHVRIAPPLLLLEKDAVGSDTEAGGGDGDNRLLLGAAASLGLATAIHAPAFAQFASQWASISAAGVSGEDFWAPLRFWAFFAIGHPLIKPAVWIGEVLHTAPGPLVGLLPLGFVLGNLAVLALLATQPKVRLAAPVVSAALLVNFVGGGLEGSVSSSDYNLALDDGVKGCPAYEQVRQPSMDGFDITKERGRAAARSLATRLLETSARPCA